MGRPIIFLDTPGIHKARNKLGEYMVNVAEHTLGEVDVILWLVEPTTFIGAGERHIAEQLNKGRTPVILVINKIDTIKKQDEILTFIAAYKDICDFAEIVPVSALKERNTDVLVEQIFKYLPYGPMFYDEDTVTDQPMRQIAAELIREKALRMLDEEIPHGIAVTIEKMNDRKRHITDIEATIICERESHKGIIIGKGGAMLKKIGTAARQELEHMLERKVNLQLQEIRTIAGCLHILGQLREIIADFRRLETVGLPPLIQPELAEHKGTAHPHEHTAGTSGPPGKSSDLPPLPRQDHQTPVRFPGGGCFDDHAGQI